MKPVAAFVMAAAAVVWAAPAARAQETPVAQLQRSGTEFVDALDHAVAGERDRLANALQVALGSHFDFQRLTVLVLGTYGRGASPQQRSVLAREVSMLLAREHARVLLLGDKAVLKSVRVAPGGQEATMAVDVVRDQKPPLSLSYVLAATPQGWKAIDVVVEGVSFAQSNRNRFAATLRAQGIDGLIASLADENAQAHARPGE